MVFSANCLAGGINESAVRDILAEVDQAILDKNAHGIAKHLSDDVSITMNLSMGGNNQTIKLTKSEYIQSMKKSWTAYQDYIYQKKNVVIDIVNGSKAIVKADVFESMTVQGQTISANTREESTIEVVNGRPLFTRIVGDTTM